MENAYNVVVENLKGRHKRMGEDNIKKDLGGK
jgi:hypothetical protein